MASKPTTKTTSSSPSTMKRTTAIDIREKYRPKKTHNEDIFDWFKDPQNVYCGRSNVYRKKVTIGPNENDVRYLCVPPKETCCFWKNPYKVGKDGTLPEVLEKFRSLLLSEVITFMNTSSRGNSGSSKKAKKSSSTTATNYLPRLFRVPSELCGKTLGCWCVGEHACHTQILAFAANLCLNMNIRNESDMRRILEEEQLDCNSPKNEAVASTKNISQKGFIQRLKEVDLMSLDVKYEAKRSTCNKKKAAVKSGGNSTSSSNGIKRNVQSTIPNTAPTSAKKRLLKKLGGNKRK
mmetsp:Transcript_17117/g.25117  ORF Transcript_17117/g.25117 Transcript_17117/m.25117 type:complete len:293 (+) Transcript_17117:63-941(+)